MYMITLQEAFIIPVKLPFMWYKACKGTLQNLMLLLNCSDKSSVGWTVCPRYLEDVKHTEWVHLLLQNTGNSLSYYNLKWNPNSLHWLKCEAVCAANSWECILYSFFSIHANKLQYECKERTELHIVFFMLFMCRRGTRNPKEARGSNEGEQKQSAIYPKGKAKLLCKQTHALNADMP